jgi:acyl dehydratase
MALNLDIVGRTSESVPVSYDEDAVILYALGIGAGVEELDFVYEKKLKVFPTFSVIPFMPLLFSHIVPLSNINLVTLLHGEHKVIIHQPLPPSATVHTTLTIDSIYDKGDKGAVINLTLETLDDTGSPLFDNKAVLVDRSAGNFGGERGPKTEPVVPPDGQAPDFCVEQTIPISQAALYRLNGDKNPLHIDPDFARKAGFDRPILHGLCAFGYAGRAILHNACGSDPARLKSFSVRFTNVVYPGDRLTTRGWKVDGDGSFIVQTTNQDGKVVLGNALAEIASRA